MSRQDKLTTERNAKVLREMLRLPENKLCADCKRNDPRWASWNIGVFLCIRCSGIHRSMGTHISKVKSVDLDTWTQEQMQNMEKWGNSRANLYWEAHLKPGHIPPEHKMESFIRSKYESRRWAPDEPPPSDPRVLAEKPSATINTPSTKAYDPPNVPPIRTSALISDHTASQVSNQPRAHQLLSSPLSKKTAIAQPVATTTTTTELRKPVAAPPTQQPTAQDDLFSLDFRSPPPAEAPQQAPKKDVKQDILSLFSTPSTSLPASNFNPFQSSTQPVASLSAQWGQSSSTSFPAASPLVGSTLTQPNWNASSNSTLWNNQAPQSNQRQVHADQGLFATQNVWGNNNSTDIFSQPFSSPAAPTKKDDAFGDLWGSFK